MNRNFVTLLSILFFSLQSFSSTSCKSNTLPQIQLVKTSLQVTVRNNLGNLEEGAEVKLFKTDEDYRNGTNVIAQQTTDDRGRAKFDELESTVYFFGCAQGRYEQLWGWHPDGFPGCQSYEQSNYYYRRIK